MRYSLRTLLIMPTLLLGTESLFGMDRVVMKKGEGKVELVGRVEVEAEDGGVLLLTRDGQLWAVTREEMVDRTKDEKQFAPFSPQEIAKRKLAELPPGFKDYKTDHYVICYNTPLAYAQWVGALYERLYAGFFNFWKNHKRNLKEPQFPLVVIVFASRDGYAAYARNELGEGAKSIIGYYHLNTNQVTSFDLTEIAGAAGNQVRIETLLAAPGAERNVATMVHEATHQLAYNSGLQVRFSDVPMWVSEGLAIYFETPDLGAKKGWKTIGAVNQHNLTNFHKSIQARPVGVLETLLANDKRFRDPNTAAEAYGEAWAFNYYLFKKHGDEYVKYLQVLADQRPCVTITPDERRKSFQDHFGDFPTLEADFLRLIRNMK